MAGVLRHLEDFAGVLPSQLVQDVVHPQQLQLVHSFWVTQGPAWAELVLIARPGNSWTGSRKEVV